jgi:hypothetical protein
VGAVTCGGGAVLGVVWLVVAPQPMAAMALNRIAFLINVIAESSA